MPDKEVCSNWLRYDAIRETVKEYETQWGTPGEPLSVLTEFQMTQNCMECNRHPEMTGALDTLTQISDLFKSSVMVALEKVGMKRKCFKVSIAK